MVIGASSKQDLLHVWRQSQNMYNIYIFLEYHYLVFNGTKLGPYSSMTLNSDLIVTLSICHAPIISQ